MVTELLSCNENNLVMELYNLLITPTQDFSLRWHRDDISPDASPEEEIAKLSQPAWHAQWNLALHDDESLVVIPGSHARARTASERNMDPYESHVPGQKIVHLKAGDAVFYKNSILHRGVYHSNVPRMTLHGSIGHVNGAKERARNVLQHGVVEWVKRCDTSSLEPERIRKRAEEMRERLLRMGDASGDVGFSQPD
ncbi:Protein N-terminal and lysine N-methyltransferase efm7 [Lecanora helva]